MMEINMSTIYGYKTKVDKINQCKRIFEEILKCEEPERTNHLTELMNIMEHEFYVFSINPTDDFMKQEEVELYREISMARVI